MAVSLLRERYRVDLPALQATCEANYLRLMRLLPNMREPLQGRRVALSQGDHLYGVMVIEVQENCPYTTTLILSQEQHNPWLPLPRMQVRVYHDANMAEVIEAEHARRFQGRYSYPNALMHQPDEKAQINGFLGEWLAHCLACGHELASIG